MKFFNTQVAYIPQDYVFINVRKKGTWHTLIKLPDDSNN